MPAQVSKGLHGCSRLIIVSVIASFDTKGTIAPLYIRIGEESYKVEKWYLKEKSNHNYTYRCAFRDGEYMREGS